VGGGGGGVCREAVGRVQRVWSEQYFFWCFAVGVSTGVVSLVSVVMAYIVTKHFADVAP